MAEDKAGTASTSKTDKAAAKKAENLAAALEKIAAMPDQYRAIAERLHAVIVAAAPELDVTTWYGMPAYVKSGKVVCFFRADTYLTLGLTEDANLALERDATDRLRPSSWFFDAMDAATEAKIAEIVRKAAS
jgi:hypothetical protein